MPSPLIGVTAGRDSSSNSTRISISEAYLQAVIHAGGIPVVIPTGIPSSDVQTLCSRLDGLLLTGGADVDPTYFNGKPHPRVYGIDRERDDLEIGFVKWAAQVNLPFLGICRGIQVINVALGGTLYTDVADQHPNAIRHDYFPDFPRDYQAHAIRLTANSKIAAVLDCTELKVNSMHHQGVEQIAPPMRSTAHAPDGLVESIELPDHPFALGVQWHPECMPDSQSTQALFNALVQASTRKIPR